MIIRFLQGIASAMVFPIAMAFIGDIAPPHAEGRYIGSFTSSMFLGMGIGPLLGGVLTDMAGMDAAFIGMTILTAIALLTCIIFLPDQPGHVRIPHPFLALLTYPGLKGPIFYQMINAFANGTFLVFLPVIAAHIGNLTAGETGTIISISVLSTAVLQRNLGRVADRFNKYYLIALGSLIITAALILVPYFHGFWPYVFFAVLMGVGGGVSVPAMYALVTISGREVGQGSAMGAVNMVMSVGMVLAPLICGTIMDQMGIREVFSISGLIVLISVPIFIIMGYRISK